MIEKIREQDIRTVGMLGEEAVMRLHRSKVAVFGVGGVGSYAVEALARAGIGAIDLYDSDVVDITNLNRQLIALNSNVGSDKVAVARDRVYDISPETDVEAYKLFIGPDSIDEIDFSQYDYCVDAIDNVTGKLLIIERAKRADVPVISCMGTGNKLDVTSFRITDIEKTSVCPLAKVMRKELRDRGIKDVEVLFSTEQPVKTGERVPASNSFVPAGAGLIIAGHVIKRLAGI